MNSQNCLVMKTFSSKKIFACLLAITFLVILFAPLANAITPTQQAKLDALKLDAINSVHVVSPAKIAADIGLGALSGVAALFNWIIDLVASGLILLAVWLIEVALGLNSNILAMPAVQVGWVLMRDVANLGFVLGIIVIAFATIIRQQNYGVKNLLVKLIVAAVLVNLSLPIAGLALDAAGIPTQFFIDKISNNTGTAQFGQALASVFKIQVINETAKSSASIALNALGASSVIISSTFFSAIFSLAVFITLAAIGIMLLIRFVAIGMLLIVMPLAILFAVFPKFSSNFDKWLEQFLRWTFFAPTVLFFIYLAIYTVKVQEGVFFAIAAKLQADPSSAAAALPGIAKTFGSNPAYLIGSMILMIGLAMGGLFVANSISLMGGSAVAQKAFGFAKGGSKALGGYMAKLPFRGIGAVSNATGLSARLKSVKQSVVAKGKQWQTSKGGLTSPLKRAAGRRMAGEPANPKGFWATMKKSFIKETGLFQYRTEKKDKDKQKLSEFYSRISRLRGERDDLEKRSAAAAAGTGPTLSPREIDRLSQLVDDELKYLRDKGARLAAAGRHLEAAEAARFAQLTANPGLAKENRVDELSKDITKLEDLLGIK